MCFLISYWWLVGVANNRYSKFKNCLRPNSWFGNQGLLRKCGNEKKNERKGLYRYVKRETGSFRNFQKFGAFGMPTVSKIAVFHFQKLLCKTETGLSSFCFLFSFLACTVSNKTDRMFGSFGLCI